MRRQTYLVRRETSQHYYFRRAIPPHPRALLGKLEIVISLRTRDRRTATRLARQHAADSDAQFVLHEQLVRDQQSSSTDEVSGNARPLEPHHIATLAERYRETLIATQLEHPPIRSELADMRAWYSQLETELTDAVVL